MSKAEYKDVLTKVLDGSGILVDRPCFLHFLFSPVQSGISKFYKVYNGFDVSGRLTLALWMSGRYRNKLFFEIPIYFSRGIYLKFVDEDTVPVNIGYSYAD